MLLRRITEHVKAQNWTAVALDFFIVVVGVFIGIQVANWNAAQQDRVEEQRLITQLLEELDDEITRKLNWIDQSTPRLDHMGQALLIIQSDDPGAALTQEQCVITALSHIIVFSSSTLPTLEEMLVGGGLGRIRQASTRNALMRYQTNLAEIEAGYHFIRNDFANLIDTYGDVFQRSYDPQAEAGLLPIPTQIICNIEKMRTDSTLRNKLVSNFARTQGLHDSALTELALLKEIKQSLGG